MVFLFILEKYNLRFASEADKDQLVTDQVVGKPQLALGALTSMQHACEVSKQRSGLVSLLLFYVLTSTSCPLASISVMHE